MGHWPCFLSVLLLLVARVDAECKYEGFVRSHISKIYKCEGGSVADLEQIPDSAEWIEILNMPVGKITESLFSPFTSHLKVLKISMCQLTNRQIEDNAFGKLRSLSFLSLEYNNLTKVKSTWFKNAPFLRDLILHSNKIQDIEEGAFGGLHSIDLIDNNLTRVRGEWFNHSVDLRFFFLGGNRIDRIDNDAFDKLTDLRLLDLKNNNLREVKAAWFGNAAAILVVLELSGNRIDYFDAELIKTAVNLLELRMNHNKLNCTSIKEIVLGLPKLELLEVSGNSDSECTDELRTLEETRKISLVM